MSATDCAPVHPRLLGRGRFKPCLRPSCGHQTARWRPVCCWVGPQGLARGWEWGFIKKVTWPLSLTMENWESDVYIFLNAKFTLKSTGANKSHLGTCLTTNFALTINQTTFSKMSSQINLQPTYLSLVQTSVIRCVKHSTWRGYFLSGYVLRMYKKWTRLMRLKEPLGTRQSIYLMYFWGDIREKFLLCFLLVSP